MNFDVRDYSGRGMYGRECLAITTPDTRFNLLELGISLGEQGVAYEEIHGLRWDNMGLGMVYYWPHIPYVYPKATSCES